MLAASAGPPRSANDYTHTAPPVYAAPQRRRRVGFTPPGHAARASVRPSTDCRDPMARPGDGNGAPPAMRFQCLALGSITPKGGPCVAQRRTCTALSPDLYSHRGL